jgi:hypothetical protein
MIFGTFRNKTFGGRVHAYATIAGLVYFMSESGTSHTPLPRDMFLNLYSKGN